MATRQLVNHRIDRVFDAWWQKHSSRCRDMSLGTPVVSAHHSRLRAFQIEKWDRRSSLRKYLSTARHTGTEHDGVSNVAVVSPTTTPHSSDPLGPFRL
jgi:hypothetical protein